MEPHPNPFAPPAANLDGAGLGRDDQFVLRYELGRFMFAAWQVQHVFLRPTVHVLLMGLALLVALGNKEEGPHVGLFVFSYVFFLGMLCGGVFVAACLARNPRLFTPHRVSLQPDGLVVETRFGRSLHYWNGIERVRSGVFFVAVYINSSAVQLIASSAFMNPSHQLQFVELLRARRSAHG